MAPLDDLLNLVPPKRAIVAPRQFLSRVVAARGFGFRFSLSDRLGHRDLALIMVVGRRAPIVRLRRVAQQAFKNVIPALDRRRFIGGLGVVFRTRVVHPNFIRAGRSDFDDIGVAFVTAVQRRFRRRCCHVAWRWRRLPRFVGRGVRSLGLVFVVDIVVALRRAIGLDQRLPVRRRDLIIVGMDFRERQESMAIAAVVHEARLQRRFDPRYFGEIDVPFKRAACCRLVIEFLDSVAIKYDDACFFRVARVHQHSF